MTKKLLQLTKIALLICSFTFLLGACSDNQDPINETQWDVRDFVVTSNMWRWDPVDECYFCEFNHNRLSNFVAESGAVSVSAFLDGTFRPLPFINYFWDDRAHYLCETINFEYGTNFIRFNFKASDLFDNVNVNTFRPGTYTFKTTLIW